MITVELAAGPGEVAATAAVVGVTELAGGEGEAWTMSAGVTLAGGSAGVAEVVP